MRRLLLDPGGFLREVSISSEFGAEEPVVIFLGRSPTCPARLVLRFRRPFPDLLDKIILQLFPFGHLLVCCYRDVRAIRHQRGRKLSLHFRGNASGGKVHCLRGTYRRRGR